MWFEAKVRNNSLEGPKLVLKQLELVRLQSKKVQELIAPHVARSAWYSHSKAVLQTLLCSESRSNREFAVEKILEVRNGKQTGDLSNSVRVHVETFNPAATEIQELCSWDSNAYELVLACSLYLQNIRELVEIPMIVGHRPVHGQGMERMVK